MVSRPGYFSAQKHVSLFSQGVRNVASVCLQIGYPTIASVPHSIINGYKRVLAVAVETDYTFPLAEKVTAASAPQPRALLKAQRALHGNTVPASYPERTQRCL